MWSILGGLAVGVVGLAGAVVGFYAWAVNSWADKATGTKPEDNKPWW